MDNGRDSQDLRSTLFGLEGDTIFFRGLDTGRDWNGYACPLFDTITSNIVARYISFPRRMIRYDKKLETFRIIVKGDSNQYILRKREYDGDDYYDFGGTARWKKA